MSVKCLEKMPALDLVTKKATAEFRDNPAEIYSISVCCISFMILDTCRITNTWICVSFCCLTWYPNMDTSGISRHFVFRWSSEHFHLAFFMFLHFLSKCLFCILVPCLFFSCINTLGGGKYEQAIARWKIAKKRRDTFYLIIFISNVHINVVQYI